MSTKNGGSPVDEEEEEYWLRLLSDLGSEPSVPLSMRPPPASPVFVPEDLGSNEAFEENFGESNQNLKVSGVAYDDNMPFQRFDQPATSTTRFEPTSSQVERTQMKQLNVHARTFSGSIPDRLDILSRQGNDGSPLTNNSKPNEDSRIPTPNYPPPLPPKSHPAQKETHQGTLHARSEDADEDTTEQRTLPDMWGESDEYISDQIDFIFCSDNMEDYEDPYSDDTSTLDALALCRSSLNQLKPVLRNAVGYAAGKVQQAGQALYQHSSTLTSRAISQKLANPALNATSALPGDDSPARYGPSVGSLHHTILFLAQHLDSAALSKYVRTASGTVVTLRDIAVMHIARYVRSNVYLSSFVGVVHESTLFMVDRLRAGVELYSHILQGDDPEKMHLELLKDKPDWQHLLLRCSMASLTWKQRQLLEETRDGGSITNADFKRLVQAQILQFDRQRVAKIAKEYFYIPPVEAKSNEGEEKLHHLRVGDASHSSNVSKDSTAGAGTYGENTVNTKALKSILSDTASIDMLYDYAATNTNTSSNHTNHNNHTNNTLANNNKGDNSPISSISTKMDTSSDASMDNDHSTDILKTNIHSWLVEEATLGDEDAQYALARFFTPPGFMEATCCALCDRTFSITLFRHHCRFCGRSVCDDHSTARRCIYRYGLVTPQRVCASCCENIDETHRMDGIIWRDLRVSAYLRNRLIPYFNPAVDRGIDKVFRVADYSMAVARNALTYNFPAKLALDTVEVLKRYGLTGFTGLMLREDFLESVELLKRISGMESMFSLSLHELTACVYYKLAIERGLRGSHPDSEKLAHAPRRRKNKNNQNNYMSNNVSGAGSPRIAVHAGAKSSNSSGSASSVKQSPSSIPEATPVLTSATATGTSAGAGTTPSAAESEEDDYECKDAHNLDVQLAIRFAPLALNIIYEENPVDCQRLAKLQGWDTIFTNSESDLAPEQPCYTLFGASFPPEESTSSKTSTSGGARNGTPNNKETGSEKASKQTEPVGSKEKSPLQRPAVLEAVLVIRGTQTIQDVVTDIRAAPAHFPPPPTEVEAALRGSSGAGSTDGNHGLTLHSESGDAVSPDQNSNKSNKNNTKDKWDWLAVPSHHTYACGGMVRSALYVLREVGPALRRLHAEGYQITIVGHSLGGAVAALMTYMLQSAVPNVNCVTYGCPSCVDAATSDLLKEKVLSVVLHDDVISRITPQSIRLLMRELMVFREQMFQHLHQEWVDVLRRASGLWTPRWRLALTNAPSNNNATSKSSSATNGLGAVQATERLMAQARNAELPRAEANAIGSAHTVSVEAAATSGPTADWSNNNSSTTSGPTAGATNKTEPLKAEGVAVMVDEERLAQLWLPGRILHIYIHHGQCQAAEVSRNFPDLRTIILQGNIFEDHRSERILNALLEVRAVRQAPRAAPAWQSYHDSDTCACCHSNFTWNSTFTGQAQEFRDKYNCRYCGRLVCDPCSTQRRAIPQLGHMFPKRICDQCLYKGDFASL